MYRLLTYGITGKIYRSIQSVYNSTTYCVCGNYYLTNVFPVTSGVKQGDILSITLKEKELVSM